MGRQRTRRFEITFSEKEWNKVLSNIRRYPSLKNPTTLIRKKTLDKRLVIESFENKNDLLNAINLIGNNINQTVRSLNTIAMRSTASRNDVDTVKVLANLIRDDQEKIYQLIKERLFMKYYEITDGEENDNH